MSIHTISNFERISHLGDEVILVAKSKKSFALRWQLGKSVYISTKAPEWIRNISLVHLGVAGPTCLPSSDAHMFLPLQSSLVWLNPVKFAITYTFGNLLSLGR